MQESICYALLLCTECSCNAYHLLLLLLLPSRVPLLPCWTLQGLPDADVVRVLWVCIMRSINLTGKNQMQIMQGIIAKTKTHHKLLATFITNAKLELTSLVTLQVGGVYVPRGVGGPEA